jgi:sRNA-binding protein
MKPRINPFEKRKKEFARKERQKKKAERREARERERAERPATENEEDPDIAGIVPGPQPPPDVES